MSRPPFEVADIIRSAGDTFREQYGGSLTWPQRKVLDAIVRCRTAALGGHRDQCLSCGQNKRQLFSLLFEASAASLLDVAADPKHLGAELGFLSILHTWGQTLTPHPQKRSNGNGSGARPPPGTTQWM